VAIFYIISALLATILMTMLGARDFLGEEKRIKLLALVKVL